MQCHITGAMLLTAFFYSNDLYVIPVIGCLCGFLGLVVHTILLKIAHHILAFVLLIGTLTACLYGDVLDIVYITILTQSTLLSRLVLGRCIFEHFDCQLTFLPVLNRMVYNCLLALLIICHVWFLNKP